MIWGQWGVHGEEDPKDIKTGCRPGGSICCPFPRMQMHSKENPFCLAPPIVCPLKPLMGQALEMQSELTSYLPGRSRSRGIADKSKQDNWDTGLVGTHTVMQGRQNELAGWENEPLKCLRKYFRYGAVGGGGIRSTSRYRTARNIQYVWNWPGETGRNHKGPECHAQSQNLSCKLEFPQ